MTFVDFVITFILRAYACFVSTLPFRVQWFGSGVLARILVLISPSRFEVTLDNIRNSLPGLSAHEQRRIAVASYQNFTQCFVELLMVPCMKERELFERHHFVNTELLERTDYQSKPLIIVAGHYGNWEWGGLALSHHSQRLCYNIAKQQRNKTLNAFIDRCRTSEYTRVIDMHEAARDIISHLKNNGVVGILIDQAADPRRDAFVNFLGRPAVTFEAPATLALRYNANIVYASSHREANGVYTVRVEAVEFDRSDTSVEGIKRIVQKCSDALEQTIRNDPAQWSWQHKRWKYNPNDFQRSNEA